MLLVHIIYELMSRRSCKSKGKRTRWPEASFQPSGRERILTHDPNRKLCKAGIGAGNLTMEVLGRRAHLWDGKARGEIMVLFLGFWRAGPRSKGAGQCPVPTFMGSTEQLHLHPAGHLVLATSVPVCPQYNTTMTILPTGTVSWTF